MTPAGLVVPPAVHLKVPSASFSEAFTLVDPSGVPSAPSTTATSSVPTRKTYSPAAFRSSLCTLPVPNGQAAR
jgi:hypothetical protein